ncbi:DUF72 domain-containing protein [Lactobacillus sp. YT155]|uniref:DUF72 domain-containing protein n=1 Tax=Lactobacillus sp. YT155 TaxID=3060955 RepID=UPI00265EEEA1|nr:DUF72 domain-containing protein [Lactobacillus sp. YT155]MDO1604627.1 DUF72 domain-containing protein [Lactobacillus sp. YT155]
MITVGLTNWAQHPDLLDKKKITLPEYSQFYECVEVDSFFYGIKNETVTQKWHDDVDEDFRFIIKASKVITKQSEATEIQIEKECQSLKQALAPLKNKLTGILLQFPGYFDVSKENILYLRRIFDYLKDFSLIVEFRNQRWYNEQYHDRMVNLMKEYQVTLAIVDEPQVTESRVPFDVTITNDSLAFFRFHGRNTAGWNTKLGFETGARTNYDYSTEELKQLGQAVLEVSKKVKKVVVIFNNNGGLHANKNAIEFQKIIGIKNRMMQNEQLNLLDENH